ncbi:MAG: type II toxin-antitoxin system VapC family toxin [Candidatus Sumerlaeota bacterium]|nr:type II toxin-antitoxin system VapC family toxin [Candidatus Sumerlaeota bacterium]
MGLLNAIVGRRVYLDANIFIYAFEKLPEFQQEVVDLFHSFDRGDLDAVTSELTLAEILVKPFAAQSIEIVSAYEKAINSSRSLEVVPVDRAILVQAARLRAKAKLRLPDAIHLATALRAKCGSFLANDKRMPRVEGIELVQVFEAAQ